MPEKTIAVIGYGNQGSTRHTIYFLVSRMIRKHRVKFFFGKAFL